MGIVQVEAVGEWHRLRMKLDALEDIGTAAETGRQASEAALDHALRGIADRCQRLLPPPATAEAEPAPCVAPAAEASLADRIAAVLEEADDGSMAPGEIAKAIPPAAGNYDTWRIRVARELKNNARFKGTGQRRSLRYRLAPEPGV